MSLQWAGPVTNYFYVTEMRTDRYRLQQTDRNSKSPGGFCCARTARDQLFSVLALPSRRRQAFETRPRIGNVDDRQVRVPPGRQILLVVLAGRSQFSLLFLELGANDMLRGLDTAELTKNLAAILDRARERHPAVYFVIAGMRAAPNLGASYTDAFEAVYPALAKRYDALLIPFLLEGVAGDRSLNQADGIHPTAEGHRRVAELVWSALAPTLQAAPPPRGARIHDPTLAPPTFVEGRE